jgi:hypothetical protein
MTARRWIWLVLVTSTLLAASPIAQAERVRPDAVAPAQAVTSVAPDELSVYNDYATPARTYSSRRAVVHYVVVGFDAPPLNDDDGDGVPDYVERVGDAADTAIAYYEQHGFVPRLHALSRGLFEGRERKAQRRSREAGDAKR